MKRNQLLICFRVIQNNIISKSASLWWLQMVLFVDAGTLHIHMIALAEPLSSCHPTYQARYKEGLYTPAALARMARCARAFSRQPRSAAAACWWWNLRRVRWRSARCLPIWRALCLYHMFAALGWDHATPQPPTWMPREWHSRTVS